MTKNTDEYPSNGILEDEKTYLEWVQGSLKLLLSHIIPVELKQISISHCIVQSSRPRSSIAPIPFGIGIDLDKSFASKWLVDYISKFGFSITSDEVLRYKESAIESSPNHIVPMFAQRVGNNVDHNLMTLTGKGTFHGMGVISALYGLGKNKYTNLIKRNKERRKTRIIDHRGIDILPHPGSFKNGLTTFTLEPYVQL